MIWKATQADLADIVDIAERFNNKYVQIPLNRDKAASTLQLLIEQGVVLRSERGAIVGVFMDDPFRDARYLVELGWYAEDNHGIELLRQFEDAGLKAGVHAVRMSTLHVNSAVAHILRGRNYKRLEVGWTLDL